MSEPFSLSVVVPLYNEEENLPELLSRLSAVLDDLEGGPHEILFVDDGSSDGTPELLEGAAARDPRVRALVLSRNFGHQTALTAGLDHAVGDAVVIMDGDLQDAPETIPRFVDRHREGYDVVYARRERRKEPWWLRLSYFLFYRLLSAMSRVTLPLDAGDFSLLSRRVVDEIRGMPERHRYIRGLRTWAGFEQAGIPVERSARGAGESKYGASALFALAFDGIFSFSVVPLRAAILVGGTAILLTLLYAVYAVYARLVLARSPQGFTALIVVITFVSGVHLFFLGVIGEYVGRIYEETKGRPHYVVDELVEGAGTGSSVDTG